MRVGTRVRLFVPSPRWGSRRRRLALGAAAIGAVALHVLATITLIEAPRLWPSALQSTPPAALPADDPPTLELVEDEAKYAGGAKQSPAANPTPPAPPAPQTQPTPSSERPPSDLPTTPPAPQADPVPPDAPRQAVAGAPPPTPQQQASEAQPQVDLDPADGLGYGHQDDNAQIVPARPDARGANKMPPYPRAAGRRGEEGTVQMLVSIAPSGAVTSVEVAVSSGHPDLDRTATSAVEHWHFRPAMQGGHPVATQSMEEFNFRISRSPS